MVYRPLFFIWQDDPNVSELRDIRDYQFMIGHSLMGTPVVSGYMSSVLAYFPKGTWYSLETGRLAASFEETPLFLEIFNTPSDLIPLFLRGGHVIYRQNSSLAFRTNDLGNIFELAVGLLEVSPGVHLANSTLMVIGDHNDEDLMEHCLLEFDCRYDVSVIVNIPNKMLMVHAQGRDIRHDPDFLVRKISLYGLNGANGLGNHSGSIGSLEIETSQDEFRSFINFRRPQKLNDLQFSLVFQG